MEQRLCERIHPGIITMQAMLRKIDRLRLPLASRRDIEYILFARSARKSIARSPGRQATAAARLRSRCRSDKLSA